MTLYGKVYIIETSVATANSKPTQKNCTNAIPYFESHFFSFWAVKSNKIPVVSYLLNKNKSLVEATDKVGNFTPLYRAAQKGLLDMCRLLLKKGADIESTRGDGSTPFYIGIFLVRRFC